MPHTTDYNTYQLAVRRFGAGRMAGEKWGLMSPWVKYSGRSIHFFTHLSPPILFQLLCNVPSGAKHLTPEFFF
jgi:hypothetical protein